MSSADQLALRHCLQIHQQSSGRRRLSQVVLTFLLYVGLTALMYATAHMSLWLTLALAVPAAGLVVRIFILQHDCGHGALFRSKRVNDWTGRLCSLVTLTPYAHWRRQHAGHHANWNNLDRRESGADIYSSCLTVAEYRGLSPRARWRYRLLRHPLVALVLVPPLVFLLLFRFAFDTPSGWRRERRSVHMTNVVLSLLFVGLGIAVGFGTVAIVQLPVTVLAAIAGVWLFSIQHRFERATWARREAWSAADASLKGTSFICLPQPLRWFSGDIGYHHVHHLNPRIPNYRLALCHASNETLRAVRPIRFGEGLRASGYWLWDEDSHCMVRFSHADGDI